MVKIKSNLPQPLAEIDGFPTSAVREDPYAEYLELAIPGVFDGRENGCGDYSGIIGGGSNKAVSVDGGLVATKMLSPYYGSGLQFDGSDDKLNFNYQIPRFRTQDFTIEWWMNPAYVSGNYRVLITLALVEIDLKLHSITIKYTFTLILVLGEILDGNLLLVLGLT